mmetsp:Transcript_9274/g.16864  ORF Transcript_9274/g.16864 Transcript_9274/m.16864 type:complete len:440 (+) Transcript_9274:1-1320(+)
MKISNIDQVVPDRVCYQYAINAWAHSRSIAGVDKAYSLLQEMIALYQAGNDVAAPNASNFSRVMAACARIGDVERMEAVMEQLQDLYSATGDPDFEPNDDCWKAYIIGKAKTGSAVEAQGILDELIECALANRNSKLMPRRGYFIDTLVAWTKQSDRYVGAEQSTRLLERMIQLGENVEYRHLLPDSKTFDKVILAWSRTRHQSAPDHIENLLLEMERQYMIGNVKVPPNLIAYTNLMLAWQRSGRNDSATNILQLFDTLRGRCKSGDLHLCPDKYVYGIVIDTLAQSGNSLEAEQVFEEMIEQWRKGSSKVKPDAHVFHKVLEACSSRDHGGSVEKCEEYILLMKEIGLRESVLAYGYLIDALSRSKDPNRVSRATALLDEIMRHANDGRTHLPHPKDYRKFLQIIARSGIPQRNAQAEVLLKSSPRRSVPKELLPPI